MIGSARSGVLSRPHFSGLAELYTGESGIVHHSLLQPSIMRLCRRSCTVDIYVALCRCPKKMVYLSPFTCPQTQVLPCLTILQPNLHITYPITHHGSNRPLRPRIITSSKRAALKHRRRLIQSLRPCPLVRRQRKAGRRFLHHSYGIRESRLQGP
jgi:hypothetical protein